VKSYQFTLQVLALFAQVTGDTGTQNKIFQKCPGHPTGAYFLHRRC